MKSRRAEQLAGGLLAVGIRGAGPGAFEQDLDACAQAGARTIVLFDRDARSGKQRNIECPAQLRTLTDAVRQRLGAEALLLVDQEGGAVARLSPEKGFPPLPAATVWAQLPAPRREALARASAQALRDAGIDVNLAPCVDVAAERANTVVVQNGRCFSDDPAVVADRAAQWIRVHWECGLLSCVKHFPGHGSSLEDSHEQLADVTGRFDAARDLAPFRKLLQGERPPAMVMTGHLLDRDVDPHLPASLSRAHTTGTLRERLGFAGVVVTDALDMGAIAQRFSLEEAVVLAIEAGADLALCACNPAAPDQPHPAPALAHALAKAAVDGRLEGGLERLERSAARLRALLRLRKDAACARDP